MFSISADSRRNLLTVTMDGFFTIHDVQAIERQMVAALATLDCPPEEHLTLCDMSGCVLQSSEVVAAFRALIDNALYLGSRLAVITGVSAARMQVRRILPANGTMICATREEADAWLFPRRTHADTPLSVRRAKERALGGQERIA